MITEIACRLKSGATQTRPTFADYAGKIAELFEHARLNERAGPEGESVVVVTCESISVYRIEAAIIDEHAIGAGRQVKGGSGGGV